MTGNRCGIIAGNDIAGTFDNEYMCECMRPEGHDEPHLIQRKNDSYWAFQTDYECNCECCQSDEPDMFCEIYWEITDAHQLQQLLHTRDDLSEQ